MGYHIPIMAAETLSALNVEKDKLYFDGTLGGGGHSNEILEHGGRILATDRDEDAICFAQKRFEETSKFAGRYALVHDNFKNIKEILIQNKIEALDGAILDLGVSSHQIDEPERGFSYRFDGRLDMRMDREEGISAFNVVNEYSEEQLARIIFTYGEDRFARRIAKNIVLERKKSPIESTGQLVEIIKRSVPNLPKGGHPAKKTFQAIRIEVNNELSGLGEAVGDIISVLKRGARLCVITFHSLEDRIVKQTFKMLATNCICDKSLPVCVCGHRAEIKLVNKGVKAAEKETAENPRAKSATLRIAEKL